MAWIVEFEDAFEAEYLGLDQEVQDSLLAVAKLLADYGPQLGRPYADTLKGSKHANMKELRFEAGERRVARRICVRSAAQGNLACRRRQIGHEPEAFL